MWQIQRENSILLNCVLINNKTWNAKIYSTWSLLHFSNMSQNSDESETQGLLGSGGTRKASYSWYIVKCSTKVSPHLDTLKVHLSTRLLRLAAWAISLLFSNVTSLKHRKGSYHNQQLQNTLNYRLLWEHFRRKKLRCFLNFPLFQSLSIESQFFNE